MIGGIGKKKALTHIFKGLFGSLQLCAAFSSVQQSPLSQLYSKKLHASSHIPSVEFVIQIKGNYKISQRYANTPKKKQKKKERREVGSAKQGEGRGGSGYVQLAGGM